jgi:hypothetical protein
MSSLCTTLAHAGPNWQAGNIIDLTSSAAGIQIMLDTGPPDNCQGTPYGWMLISQDSKAMTAVVLTMWATGKKYVMVYTNAMPAGGYCTINQVDPPG